MSLAAFRRPISGFRTAKDRECPHIRGATSRTRERIRDILDNRIRRKAAVTHVAETGALIALEAETQFIFPHILNGFNDI